MQIEGTIRVVFDRYGMSYPKYVFVNRDYRRTDKMKLTIVRDNINKLEDALFWNTQKIFVQDELDRQAKINSDEDGLKFKFDII